MKNENKRKKNRAPLLLPQLLLWTLLTVLAIVLVWAFLGTKSSHPRLGHLVAGELAHAGVKSEVTAVLLNFRSYDTLLECFVLFLGVVGIWSLTPPRLSWPRPKTNPVLNSLVQLLIPLMVIVAGYLLWSGSHQAGGAFQAGAILGGMGVLIWLAARSRLSPFPHSLLSWGLILGPALFILVACSCLLFNQVFFHYPDGTSLILITILEMGAALSIGLSLAVLFVGRRPWIFGADYEKGRKK